MKNAYFTVASNDYVPGAYCLARSLSNVGSSNLHVIGIDISAENKSLLQSVGCKVIDRSGKEWGEVKEVLQLPSQDTLVITYQGGDFLIPFVKHFTPDIDIASKIITADNLEELL